MKVDEDVVLIAGPTASGKTRLAIEIAIANDGVIVNADSMQVYADLRIITARPDEDEEAQAQHFLFGHVDAADLYSVARWLSDVNQLRQNAELNGRKLIFVGGTGLYFNSLLGGLSPVPEIRPDVRDKWRLASAEVSAQDLYLQLQEKDPEIAKQLEISDRQRVVRALEVVESTGKSLLHWQAEKGTPVFNSDVTYKKILKVPDRAILHKRINRRFDQMIEEGAMAEVEQLLARNLDPSLPAMKAIGVPQLAAIVSGELGEHEAIEKAKAASRQYAKRQSTWFRNSFADDWQKIDS